MFLAPNILLNIMGLKQIVMKDKSVSDKLVWKAEPEEYPFRTYQKRTPSNENAAQRHSL